MHLCVVLCMCVFPSCARWTGPRGNETLVVKSTLYCPNLGFSILLSTKSKQGFFGEMTDARTEAWTVQDKPGISWCIRQFKSVRRKDEFLSEEHRSQLKGSPVDKSGVT